MSAWRAKYLAFSTAPNAVIICVPLIRANPSLAFKLIGFSPFFCKTKPASSKPVLGQGEKYSVESFVEFSVRKGEETNIEVQKVFNYQMAYPYADCHDRSTFNSELVPFITTHLNMSYFPSDCFNFHLFKSYDFVECSLKKSWLGLNDIERCFIERHIKFHILNYKLNKWIKFKHLAEHLFFRI